MSQVNGTVTADGELVTEGKVTFYPTGGGRPSHGTIGEDGTYTMMTEKLGDGVPPGSYKVTIEAKKKLGPEEVTPANLTPEELSEFVPKARKVVWVIPEKHSVLRSSTITAEVKPGEDNEINFDSADFE